LTHSSRGGPGSVNIASSRESPSSEGVAKKREIEPNGKLKIEPKLSQLARGKADLPASD
jgi:hypothetical protein